LDDLLQPAPRPAMDDFGEIGHSWRQSASQGNDEKMCAAHGTLVSLKPDIFC
jgi:hypothetical protein